MQRYGQFPALARYGSYLTPYAKDAAKHVAKRIYKSAAGGQNRHSRFRKKPNNIGKKPPKTTSYEPSIDVSGHQISQSKTTVKSPAKKGLLAKIAKSSPAQYYTYHDNAFAEGGTGQTYWAYTGRCIFDLDTFNDIGAGYSDITDNRIFVEYFSQTTQWTNAQNTPVEVVFWDVMMKTSAPSGNDPIELIKDGLGAKYENGAAATSAYLQPYMNPNMSTNFRNGCKVIKQTRVVIHPGSCHKHTFYKEFNRMYNTQSGAFGNNTAALNTIKGWTHYSFVQALGQCGRRKTTDTATTAEVRLARVTRTQIKYRVPQGKNSNQSKGVFEGTWNTDGTVEAVLQDTGANVDMIS